MITIYHNPRCSKSRACNTLINTKKIPHQVINYLKEPFTVTSLKQIINKLGIKPIELVRKNEAIWKEKFKNQDLLDQEIIQAMVDHPKLIQRPIVVNGNKAVIARPIELLDTIL
ncbi:MAG: arsenate reductase (glutaredoxin) [Flavobacteriales bacterium]